MFDISISAIGKRKNMELQREPETIVALFGALADAEAALHELQAAGVPYPNIRMGAHTPTDLEQPTIVERAELAGIAAPEQFWSLAIILDPKWRDKAIETLRQASPFALGRSPTLDNRRDDTERGAIAWRHYVFETPLATDAVGLSSNGPGTSGTTGIISSGVFAEGALAEGNPPSRAAPPSDERPSNADQPPTSDTMAPKTSTDRSRPETELK
jgi:hypothetical protein